MMRDIAQLNPSAVGDILAYLSYQNDNNDKQICSLFVQAVEKIKTEVNDAHDIDALLMILNKV